MDCLSKEQLLLLQQHLTYEVYEKFMNMFDNDEELIPEDEEESYGYILDVLKKHKYFGDIYGWGYEARYVHIPANLRVSGFLHSIQKNQSIKTHQDLIHYLNCAQIASLAGSKIEPAVQRMRVKDSI